MISQQFEKSHLDTTGGFVNSYIDSVIIPRHKTRVWLIPKLHHLKNIYIQIILTPSWQYLNKLQINLVRVLTNRLWNRPYIILGQPCYSRCCTQPRVRTEQVAPPEPQAQEGPSRGRPHGGPHLHTSRRPTRRWRRTGTRILPRGRS